MSIEDLPREILCQILERVLHEEIHLLPLLTRVCKTWKHLCEDIEERTSKREDDLWRTVGSFRKIQTVFGLVSIARRKSPTRFTMYFYERDELRSNWFYRLIAVSFLSERRLEFEIVWNGRTVLTVSGDISRMLVSSLERPSDHITACARRDGCQRERTRRKERIASPFHIIMHRITLRHSY